MKTKTPDFMEIEDVMANSFAFCSVSELAGLAQVSKKFNFFASNDWLWRLYTQRDFYLETPSNVKPQQYYQWIKNKLNEEKETALNYYVHCVLSSLNMPLWMLKQSAERSPNDHEPTSLHFFTREQVDYLLSDAVMSLINSNIEALENEGAPSEKNIKETIDKLDNNLVKHIKSFAAPCFNDLSLTLPIVELTPLHLFYLCNSMVLLKLSLTKNPLLIGQLTRAMALEIFKLTNYQFLQIGYEVTYKTKLGSIDFINLLLGFEIDVDAETEIEIGFLSWEVATARKLAGLYNDGLKIMKYVFDEIKNTNIREQIQREVGETYKPYTFGLLEKIEIYPNQSAFPYLEESDITQFIDERVRMALEYPLEESRLEMDPMIYDLMKRVLNAPLKIESTLKSHLF